MELAAFALVSLALYIDFRRERSSWENERRIERAAWDGERSKLLDRIMSRSYQEFTYHTTATTNEPDRPQMTTDLAEAAYAKEVENIDRQWHLKNAQEHPELYPDGVEAIA